MITRLDDLDVPDAVLNVRWDSVGVDRRLIVRSDGSAWLWSLAEAGPGADQVGTWRMDVDGETFGALGRLVRSVTAASPARGGRLAGNRPAWRASSPVPLPPILRVRSSVRMASRPPIVRG